MQTVNAADGRAVSPSIGVGIRIQIERLALTIVIILALDFGNNFQGVHFINVQLHGFLLFRAMPVDFFRLSVIIGVARGRTLNGGSFASGG